VFVWHGSATGLGANGTPRNAAWSAESDQTGSMFSHGLGTAGDVNGDGYADVVVGAPRYDGSQVDEGAAFVWYGSAAGLGPRGIPANADWQVMGNQTLAYLGASAGTAGDVNGDGFADVIVCASWYRHQYESEGGAFVYYGTPTGLSAMPVWQTFAGQTEAHLNTVAMAGDVNGDGYADVIAGAPYYDSGQADEGRVFVYYGNRGGLSLRPQQRRSDDAAPVAYGGRSNAADAFRLALLGRTPFGRGKVKLEWEVKPLGVPFDGANTGQSPAWLDTGTTGAAISQLVAELAPNTAYHWRVRLHYHPAAILFAQRSRWLTTPWNGWQEADLRTARAGGFGSLGGSVWYDLDGDGTRDPSEPGVVGVVVKLLVGGNQIASITTLGDGSYNFTQLPAGDYWVLEVNPPWLHYSTTPDEVPVTIINGVQSVVNFGDWNGLPAWLPFMLRNR
jgi:hypothetical protein